MSSAGGRAFLIASGGDPPQRVCINRVGAFHALGCGSPAAGAQQKATPDSVPLGSALQLKQEHGFSCITMKTDSLSVHGQLDYFTITFMHHLHFAHCCRKWHVKLCLQVEVDFIPKMQI